MRYFIHFSYFGKNYHGWQIQPFDVSVQEKLNKALSLILKSEIETVGAGRTDKGVHALEMYAHFDVEQEIEEFQGNLTKKLNSFLPKDISVYKIFPVDEDMHARFDAIKRTYQYHIHLKKNPFKEEFSWYLRSNCEVLDVKLMNKACQILLKYTDFQCFSKSNTDVFTYNCKIYEAYWKKEGNNYVFIITADRFLRNMVRAIVGTLLDLHLRKITLREFEEIIRSKDRRKAGFSVPAHGLYLTKIEYSPNKSQKYFDKFENDGFKLLFTEFDYFSNQDNKKGFFQKIFSFCRKKVEARRF